LVEAAVSGLSESAYPIPEEQLEHTLGQLSQFFEILTRWNARMDLTAARDEEELVDLFLADALVLAKHAALPPQQWVDVGSGAGAPAMTLALLRPELQLTLVEPKAKRVAFLNSVVGELRVDNALVKRARSAELGAQAFDVACSRATFPPAEWLAEGARLARSGVWVLLARGAVPRCAGWRVETELQYCWPLTGASRRALLFVPMPV
jgi:16S rRNA (guanine527-N7)-methyltransferase